MEDTRRMTGIGQLDTYPPPPGSVIIGPSGEQAVVTGYTANGTPILNETGAVLGRAADTTEQQALRELPDTGIADLRTSTS